MASEALSMPPISGSLSWWDRRFTFTTAAVLLPLLLTYVLTWLKARWIKNVQGEGDPPPVPYTVPILGNTFQFAYDTEGFLRRTLKRFGNVPFRLSVGLENLYYIPYGEPVQAMFKHARDLGTKPIIVVSMRDQFGMPPEDLAIYERDGSGGNPKPLEGWEHMDPDHRIFYNQHRDLHTSLAGISLDGMTARFVARYTARLQTTPVVSDEWTELPDLFAFLREEMFHAAGAALVGERIFELCPDLCRDFWEYDSHILTLLRRKPRWMAPKAYAARDRMLASIKKWRQYARDHVDYDDPAVAEVEYEPVWGARLMRVRAKMFDKAGASPDGCASMDLGLLWATNGNVIPATLWGLLGVLLSQNLTERALAETAESFDKDTNSFSISTLCSKPFLNGVYLEALRYCAATGSARNPVIDNFKLGGWKIPRDSLMISISWFGAHDRKFWNTGRILPNGQPEHPVDTYWAERFLEYPDDPTSGPVRKPDESIYRTASKRADKTVEDDKSAKPINHTAVLQGYFFPYGGGNRICPGRHFAKQEMLAAMAVMLHEFEIELVDPVSARKARPDMAVFATGALGPDRKVPVRMRRRKHVK